MKLLTSKAPFNEIAFRSLDLNVPLLFGYWKGKLPTFFQYTSMKVASWKRNDNSLKETNANKHKYKVFFFSLLISEQTNFRISIVYLLCYIYNQSNSNKHTGLFKNNSVKRRKYQGVTTYVIAWMLQTRSMAPSLIYTVSFSLRKIVQISVCQN